MDIGIVVERYAAMFDPGVRLDFACGLADAESQNGIAATPPQDPPQHE